MKLLLLLTTAICLSSESISQRIKHKIFIRTECYDTLQIFKNYFLSRDKHDYYPDETGTCSLPDTGTYYFSPTVESKQLFSLTAVPIFIGSMEFKNDTLQTIDLYPMIILHSNDPTAYKYEHWTFCGKPANGNLKDYTLTGHREGTFKKGKAVKTVKEYNLSGELIFVSHYTKQGRLEKTERIPLMNKSGE
jgi:hypothetical protein